MDEDITNQVRKAEPVAASDGKEQRQNNSAALHCKRHDQIEYRTSVVQF